MESNKTQATSALSQLKARFNRLFARQPPCPAIVRAVLADSLTYLSAGALQEIHDVVARLDQRVSDGVFIEVGCALGGSAIVIADAKSKSRPLFLYDVFGMIPPPSVKDGVDVQTRYATISRGESSGINGNIYYGYEPDLQEKVLDNFRRHGLPPEANQIHLVKGLVQESLYIEDAVAFAHIDCDWYEPVRASLERIEPKLISGGVLVIDDYFAWSGCRSAVDEYFSDKPSYRFIKKSRLHIIKT